MMNGSYPVNPLAHNVALFLLGFWLMTHQLLGGNSRIFTSPNQDEGAPTILTQPVEQSVPMGATAEFHVTATGAVPLIYQWRRNGVNIPMATNETLILTNVTLGVAGSYTVAIANRLDVTESVPAVLKVQAPVLQPGDNFSDRLSITGFTNQVSGNNRLATLEPGEPIHANRPGGKSVWYAWKAPAAGIVTFETVGSSFDTILAAYTGDILTNLVVVAADDDSGGFHTSRLKFNASPGVDYQVAIDGYAHSSGEFALRWSLETTTNTLPELQFEAPQQMTGIANGMTFVVDGLDPGLNFQWYFNTVPIPGSISNTLLIDDVQPTNVGLYSVRVSNGIRSVDTPAASLEISHNEEGRQNTATTDKFADAALSSGAVHDETGPPFATGTSLARGFSGTQIFSTIGADKDPGEPNHCGVIGGASRWFAYSAEADGQMNIDTSGSDFDTVLAVYIARSFDFAALQSVACNNDATPQDPTSRVTFEASKGTIYLIAVDGVNAATGTAFVNYSLTPPPQVVMSIGAEAGLLQLAVAGLPTVLQRLDVSTNLVSWDQVLITNTVLGTFKYTEPLSHSSPQRFFRVVSSPRP